MAIAIVSIKKIPRIKCLCMWNRYKDTIQKITSIQASEIIDTRLPLGLFYYQQNKMYIGIDNTTGNAWTETFKTYRKCKRWLCNPATVADEL